MGEITKKGINGRLGELAKALPEHQAALVWEATNEIDRLRALTVQAVASLDALVIAAKDASYRVTRQFDQAIIMRAAYEAHVAFKDAKAESSQTGADPSCVMCGGKSELTECDTGGMICWTCVSYGNEG
jgi:hypothetical protein